MENTKEPVKVLYFVDRMLRGGIQTFVLENWRHMDHNKVQIDFLLLDDGNTYELPLTLFEKRYNVNGQSLLESHIFLHTLEPYNSY